VQPALAHPRIGSRRHRRSSPERSHKGCTAGQEKGFMPAYLVSDVSIQDAEAFQVYRTRAAAAIARYGGRYLARVGAIEPLEGSWRPERIIIVEFPSIEQARAWYRSPEYASALEVRDRALSRDLILVDGVVDTA
jgi:uncharacterized protein (DUF1330 family)